MSDEPSDADLEAIGAPPRATKRVLVMAFLAGALCAALLAAAAYLAGERDRQHDRESHERRDQ